MRREENRATRWCRSVGLERCSLWISHISCTFLLRRRRRPVLFFENGYHHFFCWHDFCGYVCEMIHLHHEYIKKAMKRGLTLHHHLVCAVGNNTMKHSYIVPPPPAVNACCMVLPLYVSWSPSSYCFAQVCGR